MRIVDVPEFKDKTHVLKMPENTPLMDAIDAMAQHHVGSVVIANDIKVVGIFTERDLLTRVVAKRRKIEELMLSDVMTRNPKVANVNDSVTESMRRMSQGRFRHLPIVDDNNNLFGIVSLGDFVAYSWYDAFNNVTGKTKKSFLTNTQLWMLFFGPLIYLIALKLFVLNTYE